MKNNLKHMSLSDFNKKKPKIKVHDKIKQVLVEQNNLEIIKVLKRKDSPKKLISSGNARNAVSQPNKKPFNNSPNDFYLDKDDNDSEDLSHRVHEYDEEFEVNMNIYKDKKDENEEFFDNYRKVKKVNEDKDKKATGENNKGPSTIFNDLIAKYRQRGYKIPDLSVKKNLFKPSALLMEDNELLEFYKIQNKEEIDESKNINFLHNLNTLTLERRSKEDGTSKLVNKNTTNRRSSYLDKDENLNIKELEIEIKKNEEAVRKARKMLHDCNFVTDSPKKHTSTSTFSRMNSNTFYLDSEQKNLNSKLFIKGAKTLKSNKAGETRPSFNKTLTDNSSKYVYQSNNNTGLRTTFESTNVSYAQPNANNQTKIINTLNDRSNKRFKSEKSKTQIKYKVKQLANTSNNFLQRIPNKKLTYIANEISSTQHSFYNEMNIMSTVANTNTVCNNKDTSNKFFTQSNFTNISTPVSSNYKKIELGELYEKVVKKEQKHKHDNKGTIYDDILMYLNHNNKYEHGLDPKKIMPRHLLSNIADIKFRIGLKDLYSSYSGMSSKVAKHHINMEKLARIKQLDNKINTLDKVLIKTLNNANI